jgi:hypothetical protein
MFSNTEPQLSIEHIEYLLSELKLKLSYEQLIQKFPLYHQERIKAIKNIRNYSISERFRAVAEDINSIISCHYCMSSPSEVLLQCQHTLCKNCFEIEILQKIKFSEGSEKISKCPASGCPIEFLGTALFKEDGSERRSLFLQCAKKSESLRDNCKMCNRCNNFLTESSFHESLILCHNFCKMCIRWLSAFQATTCTICHKLLDLSYLIKTNRSCDSCQSSVPLISGFFICADNYYCKFCCESGLSDLSLMSIHEELDPVSIQCLLECLSKERND